MSFLLAPVTPALPGGTVFGRVPLPMTGVARSLLLLRRMWTPSRMRWAPLNVGRSLDCVFGRLGLEGEGSGGAPLRLGNSVDREVALWASGLSDPGVFELRPLRTGQEHYLFLASIKYRNCNFFRFLQNRLPSKQNKTKQNTFFSSSFFPSSFFPSSFFSSSFHVMVSSY